MPSVTSRTRPFAPGPVTTEASPSGIEQATDTFVDAIDGSAFVIVPIAQRARPFTPASYTKTDATTNTVTITDGILFSRTLAAKGDSITIVSDGLTYTVISNMSASTSSAQDISYAEVLMSDTVPADPLYNDAETDWVYSEIIR